MFDQKVNGIIFLIFVDDCGRPDNKTAEGMVSSKWFRAFEFNPRLTGFWGGGGGMEDISVLMCHL